MRAELLQLAADLARKGEPFVIAMVVRKQAYSSAHRPSTSTESHARRTAGWTSASTSSSNVDLKWRSGWRC